MEIRKGNQREVREEYDRTVKPKGDAILIHTGMKENEL